jgi:Cu(I)/Ag(I) efflux system membrane fusion protein
MKLVPVYDRDKGFGPVAGLVALNSNTVNVINVQTEEVKRRPLERTLRVAGTIEDNDARHRRLSAYVEGRIEKLFVNHLGAEVVAGDPLAVIYSPTLFAAEREYAALAGQTSAAPALRAERQRLMDGAAQRLLRLGLTQAQIDAVPQKGGDDYRSEILAPMSGTVVTREIYEGQYVKEGDKLFEIADFSTMWFLFDAYERDLRWIKPGQQVEVTVPAVPGKTFTAPVSFIDPNVKDMSRSAKVRVEIQNPLIQENGRTRRELYHRLYAEGVVKVDVPAVLTVPRSAVLAPGAQAIVYIDLGGGGYEQRKVKLGRAGDDWLEVLDGLSEGDRIVTAGNMLIDAQAQLNTK